MTSVVLNKIGMDLVDVEVSQEGDAQTDMFFQDPVLDYTRDYVLAISELTVPLGEEPMLSKLENNDTLFRVFRKAYVEGGDEKTPEVITPVKFGQFGNKSLADSKANPSNFVMEDWSKFTSSRIKTAAQFFHELRLFFVDLQFKLTSGRYQGVLAGVEFGFKVFVSPGGTLSIQANAAFWKRFYIEFTSYGRALFQHKYRYVHFGPGGTTSVDGASFVTGVSPDDDGVVRISSSDSPDFVAADDLGPGSASYLYRFSYSLLEFLEHRLRIEVDADLSIPANILVENGQQKMHYNIASFALPTTYKSTIVLNSTSMLQKAVHLKSDAYVSDTVVKAKTTPTVDWYRLQNSSNVQNMRLHIFVVRREFDQNANEWQLVRNKLNVAPNARWSLSMKFVQTF